MSARLALALVTGATGAVLTYALLRLAQALLVREPDPALVLYSEHAGYFWRAWTAAYAGGAAGFAAALLAQRDAARLARALATAVPFAAALACAQALLVP